MVNLTTDGGQRGPGWSEDHKNGLIMSKIELLMYMFHWLNYAVHLRNYVTDPNLNVPKLFFLKRVLVLVLVELKYSGQNC